MLCEDKLPESTGDKLTAWGDEFQLSWGTRLDSPGEVLNCNFCKLKEGTYVGLPDDELV